MLFPLPSVKKELSELPYALRETLEKGRAEYDNLVRRTAWGDPPVYFVGTGPSFSVARYAAEVFESLLGWPCTARRATELSADALTTVQPRSVFLFVSDGTESPEIFEAANAVRKRNGIVLALVASLEVPLATSADGVFLVHTGAERGHARLTICMQAAAGYIALLAAKAFKRNRPLFTTLEREFRDLPGHVNWALTQLREAVRALASELTRAKDLTILAGGSYSASAASAAALLRDVADIHSQELNSEATLTREGLPCGRNATLLVLTGSRCRAQKQVQRIFEWAKRKGARILSVTDGNDSILARQSTLALLLPPMSEPTGAILAHAVLAWAAYEARKLTSSTPSR